MVIEEEAGEGVALEEQHRLRRAEVPLADEALGELRHRPLHVAEVDVEDAPLRAEELDHLADVRRAAGHLGAAAEAEVQPARRGAIAHLVGPLEVVYALEDARD